MNTTHDMPEDWLKNTLAVFNPEIEQLLAGHAPEPYRDAIGFCFENMLLIEQRRNDLPFLPDGNIDWQAFHERCQQPEPEVEHALLKLMVGIISGRSDGSIPAPDPLYLRDAMAALIKNYMPEPYGAAFSYAWDAEQAMANTEDMPSDLPEDAARWYDRLRQIVG